MPRTIPACAAKQHCIAARLFMPAPFFPNNIVLFFFELLKTCSVDGLSLYDLIFNKRSSKPTLRSMYRPQKTHFNPIFNPII